MSLAVSFVVILVVVLFALGLALLIPGIVGTIITGKVKHSPKVLRILSILALIFGIVLCVFAFLSPFIITLFTYM